MTRSKGTAVGLLAQLLISGLVLVGWGLDDVRGFFAHAARAGLFVVAVLGTAFVVLSNPDVNPFRKGEKPVSGQAWLVVFIPLTVFLAVFLPYADRRGLMVFPETNALRYFGLGLNAVGSAIRLTGLRTLGKQFSGYVTLQKDHQLIQSGIYGFIRHPMYLGVLLALPGFALAFRSWLALPLLVVFGALLLVRIEWEEKLLAEHFGAEFDVYRHRTWRLLPYLY